MTFFSYTLPCLSLASFWQLLLDDGEGVMEIDIPREAVGKLIGTRGRVINSIRQLTHAEIRLSKDEEGNGTLLVQGFASQLDRVATLVQMVVTCPESDVDVIAMVRSGGATDELMATALEGGTVPLLAPLAGGEEDEEYMMPLPPLEARRLDDSRQMGSLMRAAGVRASLDRSSGDGWVSVTLRGSASAIELAKQRIESITQPMDAADELAALTASCSQATTAGGNGHGGAMGAGATVSVEDLPSPVPEVLVGAIEGGGGEFRIEIELTNKDQVGAVIGEGGRTINAIRAAAGVSIQVEPADEARAASTQRRLIVTGSEASCMHARAMLHRVLRSNIGKRDYSQPMASEGQPPNGSVLRLTVPRHLVGRVIGKRGATIKKLRERSNALIEIAKDEHGVGVVSLSGSPTAVREAREQIEELTQEDLPLEVSVYAHSQLGW